MTNANCKRVLKNSGRFLACLLAGAVTTFGVAHAALVESVNNGSFEDGIPTGSLFNNTVPSWSEFGDFRDAAGWWDNTGGGITATHPITDLGAGSLIVRSDNGGEDDAWLFQSLGTVSASDVGKVYSLSADFGARDFYSNRAPGTYGADVNLVVAFRAGTTSTGDLGTALGAVDGRNIGTDNAGAIIPFTTHTATFEPSLGDIGTEVFAVVSLKANSFLGGGGQRQYTVDNVAMSVVPEPSTFALLAGIAVGGLALRRRQ